MESENPKDDKKYLKEKSINPKEIIDSNNDSLAPFNNMIDLFVKTGTGNYNSLNQNSDLKLNEVEKAIAQFASSLEICQYLYSEKRKCADLASKAKFNGNGIDRKISTVSLTASTGNSTERLKGAI